MKDQCELCKMEFDEKNKEMLEERKRVHYVIEHFPIPYNEK